MAAMGRVAEQVHFRRLLDQRDMRCPVAEAVGGTCVWCPIEETVIDARLNPTATSAYCMGDYKACPTWRAEKQRVWAARREPLVQTGVPSEGLDGRHT
jgi:hypothetical protein